ncbi:MAG: transposase family protein [Gemmataceae bacterium]|nr:transposase family protein [Gemmataceae bacterium]
MARLRQEWFERFLELPNGVPSRHTFERVFDRLNPRVMQQGLLQWLHSNSELLGVRHIAIDGKSLRGSGGGNSPFRQLHLVSAGCSLVAPSMEWEPRSSLSLPAAGTETTTATASLEDGLWMTSVEQGELFPSTVRGNVPPSSLALEDTWKQALAVAMMMGIRHIAWPAEDDSSRTAFRRALLPGK